MEDQSVDEELVENVTDCPGCGDFCVHEILKERKAGDDLLKAQEDPINGGTLLDHTMVLFGCGMATGTHSTRNLPLLLAGGGFRHGESKIYPEEDARHVPAANLLLSMLQNFGVEADRFGTSTGTLTGLERKS